MIRDINIDNRKIYISYSSSQKLLYPSEDIFPSDKLFPAEWIEFSNIVQGSVHLSEVIVDSQITFGQLFCSEFEVTVYDIDDISGKYIQVYMEDDGVYKNIFFGQVVSCKLDNTELDRQIVAYDSAYALRDVNVAGWWNLFWADKETATVKECRESLLLTQEVPFEDVELDNDNVVIRKNVDFTYMAFGTVLQMLCEINGCFPHFSRNGTLEFIVFQTEQQTKDITNLYEGLNSQFEDYTVDAVTGIEFYDSDNELKYLVGTPENTYKMSSNIFLYDMGTNELEAIGQTLLDYLSELTYRPANVKMIVGDLFYELGDRIHTPKGDFYIMEQEFSASQLIEQTMICKGEQKLGKSSRNLNNDLIIMNEKYSKLTYNVEEFRLEFGDYKDEVNSRFEVTDEHIVMEVQKGTKDMHPTYSGSYVPTASNYPANEWTTEALKQKNLDCTFYNTAEGRTYRWAKKPNAVRLTFGTDSSTEGSADYVAIYCYYNNQWRRSRLFYGGYGGSTNNIAGKSCIIPTNLFYVIWYTDGSIQDYGFSIAAIDTVYSENPLVDMPTVQTVPSYTQTVISGIKDKPESEHPYRTNVRQRWQWNTGLAISTTGYEWVPQEKYSYHLFEITAEHLLSEIEAVDEYGHEVNSRLEQTASSLTSEITNRTNADNNLSSRITQNANSITSEVNARASGDNYLSSQISQMAGQISLKVDKNGVSSALTLDGGDISLTGNRIYIESDNFTLTWDGKVTCSEAEIHGELYTGDVHIYDSYIKYNDNNYIDMYGYVGDSSGIHINGNQVVLSSDSFGVTEWRDSTTVYYGETGEYHYRDEYGSEHCFKFLHGVLVDWW